MTPRRPSVKPLIFLVSAGFGLLCFATVSRYGPEANWAREWLALLPLQFLALGYVVYRNQARSRSIAAQNPKSPDNRKPYSTDETL